MVKTDLREQGCFETVKYPKLSIISAIWVISAVLIIAGTFFCVLMVNSADNDFIDWFDDTAYSVNNFFGFNSATSVIYLILWIFIGASLYFAEKNSPHKNKWKTAVISAIFIIFIAALIFFFMMLIADNYNNPEGKPPVFFDLFDLLLYFLTSVVGYIAVFVLIIIFIFIYLVVKLIMTRLICKEKERIIKLQIMKGMPVCYYNGALKFWHIIAVYFLPVIFMYSLLYVLMIRSEFVAYYFMVFFFVLIFLTFDLTAVIYTLFFKIKDKPDYISLDHHIYEVTLFKQSYVKFNKIK